MKLVSPALRHIVYPGLSRAGYFRRHASSRLAVVTYHGIFPDKYRVSDGDLDGNLITMQSFRRQLQLLKSQYNVISPEDFLSYRRSRKPFPQRSVLLTCDDGLENVLTFMTPILQEQALSCLFFVLGASIENEPSLLWYEELYLMLSAVEVCELELPQAHTRARVARREEKTFLWRSLVREFSKFGTEQRESLLREVRIQLRLPLGWDQPYKGDPIARSRFCTLTLPELESLAATGMAIGAHTSSHPMLSMQPAELAWAEISESRRALEQALGRPIWALAYPFGNSEAVGEREFEMASRAGFDCAFLNTENFTGVEDPPFALSRIHVTATMTLAEFEAHVSGFFRSLRSHFVSTSHAAGIRRENAA